MKARLKERAKGARESMGERKDVGSAGHIVEGNDACFIVQENSHAPRGLLEAQGGLRGCESFVLLLATLADKPVSVGGRGSDLPLPAHRLTTHPQGPFGLVSHVHLPVVTARREVLSTQDADDKVKSLGAIGHRLPSVSKLHTSLVLRQDEFGMCCVRVQGHCHYRESQTGEAGEGKVFGDLWVNLEGKIISRSVTTVVGLFEFMVPPPLYAREPKKTVFQSPRSTGSVLS